MKYHNPFIYETIERIVSIEREGEFAIIECSDTIFYPGGGGQPADKGYFIIDGEQCIVIDVYKNKSAILHKIKWETYLNLDPGNPIEMIIDKNRRNQLIRMHSGEHLFMGSLLKIYPELKVEKVRLEENESSLYIIPNGKSIEWEKIFEAENIANKVINENRKIKIHLIDKNQAKSMFPKARIKFDRIQADTIRIIEIDEHDYSACAGIHCTTTKFIGNFLVTKFGQIGDKYEIKFKVNVTDELFDLSKYSRISAAILKINPSELPTYVEQLLKQKEEYKDKIRKLMSETGINVESLKVNDINIHYSILEDFDKKQLTDKLNEIFEHEKDKKVVILFNKINNKIAFSMKISSELGNVTDIIRKEQIHGGGREQFASGICESPELLLKKIKKYFTERLF